MHDMGYMDIEQLGDPSAPNSLGNSTVKQYLCGIGYLQLVQHHLLYGDMQVPKLSALTILTTDARTRRRNENRRKNDSLMDAARHAPQIREPTKERKLMDSFMDRQGAFQQAAGLRHACLWTYQMATASRGEQVRNLRECQRLNFDIEPEEGFGGSLQTMQLIAFTKDGGQTSPGDIRDLAAIALHKDVLQDFQVMHAMYGAHKVHVMPDGALPPYLDGKQAYYGYYIFTTSPNPASQMSLVAHSEAFKQAYQEAGYTENGQVTHRPRHEVPTDLRLKYSVSEAFDAYGVMVEAIYPDIGEMLEQLQQRNKTCPVAERDVAGTHGIAGKKRDAQLIIQAAPFCEAEWPDLLL
ncbi:hypothetical protein WJX77_003479 [Trebouxia sp. C0004]